MELYPSSVEKNFSGCSMEYSPNPMLPLNPCIGMTSIIGRGSGADVHGFNPISLMGGMNSSDGRKSGIMFGTESAGGIRESGLPEMNAVVVSVVSLTVLLRPCACATSDIGRIIRSIISLCIMSKFYCEKWQALCPHVREK